MKYRSTRRNCPPVTVSAALEAGLAPDGGLYVPETHPQLDHDVPDAVPALDNLPACAAQALDPFFAEDALQALLPGICADALDLPLPLRPSGAQNLSVLELFHGPTAAFKDFGARFLARCLERINAGRERPLYVLVATSGDTGAAVAAAFAGCENVQVRVLFPDGLVSPRQAHQLSCWGGNVRTFAVNGRFDDCQALVKAAFRDPDLAQRFRLGSANSINVGRLLPQMAYYVAASIAAWRSTGQRPGFIVPTGNLGNALACVWARASGYPVGPVVLATNANRPIADFIENGHWTPRPSVATLASAMDVGNPSNMERLRDLLGDDELRAGFPVWVSDDAQIRTRIRDEYRAHGHVLCPHTATAFEAWQHALSDREKNERPWVAVATAHPAKFEEIVEPLIGGPVALPPALSTLLERRAHATRIDPDLAALAASFTEDGE